MSFDDQISSRKYNSTNFYCYLSLFNSLNDDITTTVKVPAHIRRIWQRGWDPRDTFYNAFLITCPLPLNYDQKIFNFVAISRRNCCAIKKLKFIEISRQQKTNNFLLKKKQSPKIAVCVKGLDFLDEEELSIQKLAEWIELQLALGADSIVIYIYYVPKRILRLLEAYEKRGTIEIVCYCIVKKKILLFILKIIQ